MPTITTNDWKNYQGGSFAAYAADRGASIRRYGNAGTDGFLVYQIKDLAGEWYNQKGDPVSVDLARAAGFDVDAQLRERDRKERLAKATASVNAEFATAVRTEIASKGGYTLSDVGMGRAELTDSDGVVLNPRPMSIQEGQRLLDLMSGDAQ
ncbi:hypothetical protein [Mesorhizobium sp. DCY119]|uniref:hypothetical protein n=1 Tax=Mesorhizobium sp. DCY119 TaxID=2108445 RepID=UPI000E7491E4|nr:hypothetical protein [Mesorhizobium sp. DCY119]RJG45868.1 hypothetical protein D3Y55_17495 [Mesorhizobium sp. DCY119]